MKKILFGLGSITTITTPIILIACGSSGLSLNQIKAAAKERIDKSKLSDYQKNKLDNELDLANDKQAYENILDEFETLLATHTQVAPSVVHHVQIIKPTKDDFSITVNGISYFIKKGSKSLVFKDFSNKTITLTSNKEITTLTTTLKNGNKDIDVKVESIKLNALVLSDDSGEYVVPSDKTGEKVYIKSFIAYNVFDNQKQSDLSDVTSGEDVEKIMLFIGSIKGLSDDSKKEFNLVLKDVVRRSLTKVSTDLGDGIKIPSTIGQTSVKDLTTVGDVVGISKGELTSLLEKLGVKMSDVLTSNHGLLVSFSWSKASSLFSIKTSIEDMFYIYQYTIEQKII